MPAKMIFLKIRGIETMHFCPIVEVGCDKCFVPPRCKGENDKNIAFNLRKVKGEYKFSRIR